MTVPDATKAFADGDTGSFDLTTGTWCNVTTDVSGSVRVLPDLVLEILTRGGTLPRLGEPRFQLPELADALRSSAAEPPAKVQEPDAAVVISPNQALTDVTMSIRTAARRSS